MTTTGQLASQLTAIQKEQRRQALMLEEILRNLGVAADSPQIVHDDERGTFVPGSGWLDRHDR